MGEYKDYAISGEGIYEIVPHFAAFKDGKVLSTGTAVFIAGNLIMTSQHVILDIVENLHGKTTEQFTEVDFQMWFAIVVTREGSLSYAVRKMVECKCSPYADIAYILVESVNNEAVAFTKSQKAPIIDLTLPKIGDKVVAFGMHSKLGEQNITMKADGGFDLVVKNHPKVSTGIVTEIIEEEIVSYRIPAFGGFRANFKSDGGMSGGPVFNNTTGKLIGIIKAGLHSSSEEEPNSTCCLIRPSLATPYVHQGNEFIFDFFEHNIIASTGLEKLVFNRSPGAIHMKL